MNKVAGTFTGTGAGLILSLGFKPTKVTLTNSSSTVKIEYDANSAPGAAGGIKTIVDGTRSKLTAAAGVKSHEGGQRIDTISDAIKEFDSFYDKRTAGAGAAIKVFVLDNPATNKGHFDHPVNTDVVGPGSVMTVDSGGVISEAMITAITGDGTAEESVTLDEACGGIVTSLLGKVSFVNAELGYTSEGIEIGDTAVNVDGEVVFFEAEC